MEENFNTIVRIIMYVVIGIAVVVVKNSKKKAAQRRRFDTLDEPMEVPAEEYEYERPEWQQTVTQHPKPEPVAVRPAKPKKQKSTAKENPRKYFTYENAEDFARAERRTRRAAESQTPTPTSTDSNGNGQGSEHSKGHEFSLRDAVIYSEILKPKFDEN